jgi:probable phosphoglycerate mutase
MHKKQTGPTQIAWQMRQWWLVLGADCYGSASMNRQTRNRYYALRHGVSVANEQRIIVSHPENGVAGWGLSDRGRAECRRLLSPAALSSHGFGKADTLVYTSDFRRAVETAEIFCELNGLDAPVDDARLRERNFGRFENAPIESYQRVWERDAADAGHSFEGCESTAALSARLSRLLDDLEARWTGRKIVLVSHGDPLQVLQTILLGRKCNEHRSLPHLRNAEIRRIP